MWWHTRGNQIWSFRETDESIQIGGGRQFSRLLATEVRASAVVTLDTSCSEVVWRVLATHSTRMFPPHFPYRASPCTIRVQLSSTRIRRETKTMRNIRFLPRYSWGLSSSGTLQGVGRQLVKDISGRPTDPIFRAQAVRKCKCLTCLTSQQGEDFSKKLFHHTP